MRTTLATGRSRPRPTTAPRSTFLVAFLVMLAVGCGGASPPARNGTPAAPATAAPDVLARLGCDTITEADLDAFRASDAEARVILGGDRDAALALLVRTRAMERAADDLHLEVGPEAVEEALARLAAEHGMTIEELDAAAGEHALSASAYRTVIARQLLAYRAANALASDLGVTVTSTEDFEEVLRRYVAWLSGIEVQIEQDGCTEVAWPPLAGRPIE